MKLIDELWRDFATDVGINLDSEIPPMAERNLFFCGAAGLFFRINQLVSDDKVTNDEGQHFMDCIMEEIATFKGESNS